MSAGVESFYKILVFTVAMKTWHLITMLVKYEKNNFFWTALLHSADISKWTEYLKMALYARKQKYTHVTSQLKLSVTMREAVGTQKLGYRLHRIVVIGADASQVHSQRREKQQHAEQNHDGYEPYRLVDRYGGAGDGRVFESISRDFVHGHRAP